MQGLATERADKQKSEKQENQAARIKRLAERAKSYKDWSNVKVAMLTHGATTEPQWMEVYYFLDGVPVTADVYGTVVKGVVTITASSEIVAADGRFSAAGVPPQTVHIVD